MQRQSLGSPASKLHGHGASSSALSSAKDDALVMDDSSSCSASKRRDSFLSSASLLLPHYDDDKSSRPHRLSLVAAASSSSSSSSVASALSPRKPEKLIHLIPLLTLFCFLVLYLCSHSPSQTDLAQFSGFKRLAKQIVATNIRNQEEEEEEEGAAIRGRSPWPHSDSAPPPDLRFYAAATAADRILPKLLWRSFPPVDLRSREEEASSVFLWRRRVRSLSSQEYGFGVERAPLPPPPEGRERSHVVTVPRA